MAAKGAGPGSGLLCHTTTQRTQRSRPAERPVRTQLFVFFVFYGGKRGRAGFRTSLPQKNAENAKIAVCGSPGPDAALCVLWRQQGRGRFPDCRPQKNAENAKIAVCGSPGPDAALCVLWRQSVIVILLLIVIHPASLSPGRPLFSQELTALTEKPLRINF